MIQPQADTTLDPAAATRDPHFVGFRGERYDFMGAPDRWFALLSDPETQVNARFASVPGADWGTYMDVITILHPDGETTVTCDNHEPVVVETPYYRIRVTRDYYEAGCYDVLNGVAHLNLEVRLGPEWSHIRGTHGVLGQTASTRWPGSPTGGSQGEGVIEGVWTDYEVAGPRSVEYAYSRSRVPMMV